MSGGKGKRKTTGHMHRVFGTEGKAFEKSKAIRGNAEHVIQMKKVNRSKAYINM